MHWTSRWMSKLKNTCDSTCLLLFYTREVRWTSRWTSSQKSEEIAYIYIYIYIYALDVPLDV